MPFIKHFNIIARVPYNAICMHNRLYSLYYTQRYLMLSYPCHIHFGVHLFKWKMGAWRHAIYFIKGHLKHVEEKAMDGKKKRYETEYYLTLQDWCVPC